MTKKLIAMVLAAVMLAGVLTGCGSIGTVQNTEPAAQNTQATEDNSNKSQITVATWDGGLGSKWLEDAAERFEELYKDKSFEEGKVGCDISIIASRSFDGSGMAFTPLTHDVYFVEGVDYYAMTNNKQMEPVTDIISTPLSEYGEEETVLNKIDPVMQEYLLAADGNYYAIPFYETFYNFSYDLDLWDAKSFYMAADGDINTFWHTVHNQFYLAPYPHEIQIALAKETTVKGLKYTPRQDSSEGRIGKYEVYISHDGKEWGKAVASGTFADSKEVQTVEFNPCKARYVKLQALSAVIKEAKMAAVAELEVLLAE